MNFEDLCFTSNFKTLFQILVAVVKSIRTNTSNPYDYKLTNPRENVKMLEK